MSVSEPLRTKFDKVTKLEQISVYGSRRCRENRRLPVCLRRFTTKTPPSGRGP